MSAKYKTFYDANCNSLCFRTFQEVKKTAVGHFLDEKCPNEMKLQFGDYFFRKIASHYTFQPKQKDEILTELKKTITNMQVLVPKASYLKYNELDALRNLCEHFYYNRFPTKFFTLQMLNDTELVKQTVSNGNLTEQELLQHFLTWITRTTVTTQKSNLLDVLLRYYGNNEEVKRIRKELEYPTSKTKSITTNAQNVHDDGVFDSALKVAADLVKWSDENGGLEPPPETSFRDFAFFILEGVKVTKADDEIVRCVVDKMCIDTTYWDHDGAILNIPRVFLALAHYIKNSIHKDSLKIVLMQEMRVMAELCSSGYIARFSSVISGFDERFTITIPPITQFQNQISHHIMKSLENASEEVIENTMVPEKFISYARDVVSRCVKDLEKEYGKEFVESNLEKVLGDICG